MFPANIYSFKVSNRNTRRRCKIRSKLTIKTPERRLLIPLNFQLTMKKLTQNVVACQSHYTAQKMKFSIKDFFSNCD